MPNFAEAMDFNNLTAAFLFACGALVATASSTFHLGASVLGSLCFAAIRPIFGGESDVFAFVGVSVCATVVFRILHFHVDRVLSEHDPSAAHAASG